MRSKTVQDVWALMLTSVPGKPLQCLFSALLEFVTVSAVLGPDSRECVQHWCSVDWCPLFLGTNGMHCAVIKLSLWLPNFAWKSMVLTCKITLFP